MGEFVVSAARNLLGVRWRHQGRSAQHGVDCVGLCVLSLRQAGHMAPDISGYPRRHDGSLLMSLLAANLNPVRGNDWQDGDVGVFLESGLPVHVGILNMSGGPSVIHAHARRRQVVEEPLSAYGQPYAVFRI